MSEPDPGDVEPAQPPLSRLLVISVAGFAALSVGWFVVSWAILNSPFIDALGETFGGVMVVLLLVSIFGSLNGPE